jgi:hypothetical protein
MYSEPLKRSKRYLRDLKEYEDAIVYFQQAIDNTVDPNILK